MATIKINITDSDVFKDTLQIIKDILEDNRISEEIRTGIKEKIEDVLSKNKED